ncbi:cytidine deaminase [Vibrio mimicus]
MSFIRTVFCFVSFLLLSGCASQKAMDLPSDFWNTSKDKKIAVAFVQPPMMYAHRSGGEGLLDLAINEIVTDSVESHIQTLTYDKFEVGKSKIADVIISRGGESIILPEYYQVSDAIELPKESRKEGHFIYDTSAVREKYQASYLLVVHTYAAGSMRDYYGFIPLSDPRGYINAKVTLVDLSDNKIVMDHQIIESVVLPEGVNWDDPENGFPEITNVVNSALEKAALRLTEFL